MDLEISNLLQQLGRRLNAVSAGPSLAGIPHGTLPPLPFNKIKIIDDDQVTKEDIVSADYTAYAECQPPLTVVAGPSTILLTALVLHPKPTQQYADQDADPRDSAGKKYLTRTVSVAVDLKAPASTNVTTRTIVIGAPVCGPTTGFLYTLEITYKGLGFDQAQPAMRVFSYLVTWSDNQGQVHSDGVPHWIYV